MEAIMVGYAVQALQAGSSKAKAAAIQQQALREQQEVSVWELCVCFGL
jgi:hypothetical protein